MRFGRLKGESDEQFATRQEHLKRLVKDVLEGPKNVRRRYIWFFRQENGIIVSTVSHHDLAARMRLRRILKESPGELIASPLAFGRHEYYAQMRRHGLDSYGIFAKEG